MAKTATTETEETTKVAIDAAIDSVKDLPATQQASNLANVSDDDFFSDFDTTGLENITAKDVSLPRWTILQGLSPQVNPRKDEYVQGAQVGMLYNTATGELATEKTFVFAAYEHRYVEWTPRDQRSACPLPNLPKPVGGGLYQDYGTNGWREEQDVLHFGPDNETALSYSENGSLWTRRGNEIQDTGTWYTIDPDTLATAFIAMAKTQFSSSRKLLSGIRDERPILRNGAMGPARVFYRMWTLTSALRSKAVDGGTNEWFVWAHKPSMLTQDHRNALEIRELIKRIIEDLNKNSVVIDVSIGDAVEASATVVDDNAAM